MEGTQRRKSLGLAEELILSPGQEEVASIALDEEWPVDAVVSRHPSFDLTGVVFLSGQVGQTGNHVKVTLKNETEESITISTEVEIILLVEKSVQTEDKSESSEDNSNNKPNKDTSDKDEIDVGGGDNGKTEGESAESMEIEEDTSPKESVEDESSKQNKANTDDVDAEPVITKHNESKADDVKDCEVTKPVENKESDNTAFESSEVSSETKEAETSSDKESEKKDCEGEEKKEERNGDEEITIEDDKKDAPAPPPTMTMRFVDETVNQNDDDASKGDAMDTDDNAADDDAGGGDSEDEQSKEKAKDEDKDKPSGLKLASFSTMAHKSPSKGDKAIGSEGVSVAAQPSVPPHVEDDGCSQCDAKIPNVFDAIVWETMQFCNEGCLAIYQGGMSSCSSCRKEVNAASLGKYCVRFGSDIKQFCSNVCLEDYKKGLKVCSYCQKDISSGEGFLAPIGDKGQFKDFCEQACLKKYEHIHLGKVPDPETLPCNVCKESRIVEREILRTKEVIKLCGDACFSAFKFVNSVDTLQCDLCAKHFDVAVERISIHYEGLSQTFCSKPCQNVFVMQKRKIVPCTYCKVKKYNFDMIEKFPPGQMTGSQLYCSLTCLTQHSAHQVNGFTQQPIQQARVPPGFPPSLPVISAVSSLAQAPGPGPLLPTQQQVQMQTQTVREVVRETHVLPSDIPTMKNKGLQTKPFTLTKGVSCRPHPCHKETQTEGLSQPVPIPIPVPIHVPTPCKMYNAPFPVPIPIPLPFPVPIFIPTTRHSMKGINKIIKKIMNKIPADPFEAELLALAGNIAGEDKDSSDSESEPDEGREEFERDVMGPTVNQPEAGDLETEMSAERVVPKPLPVSTPDPLDRQRAMGVYNQMNNKRRQSGRDSEGEDDPEGWRPRAMWGQEGHPGQQNRGRRSNRGRPRGSSNQSPAVKRFRPDQNVSQREQQAAIQQQPKERPDAHHHLKFTYGVNAWKHWVVGKNAELEKQRAQGKYQKTFETDILKLRADELNFTLCMFVKEVKKPNGDAYAADSIFYLVLGIQEYLFENGRIDNIFTDSYYDPFTSALHEVVKDFKLPVNELGYFVTRIEEEHLWEAKQLGAHSPQVLLNTLVYFNTKYFQLKTVDQHLKLSFSHIMKHWKKTPLANKPGQQQRTVLLRYYPPPAKGQKPEDRKMYEQHESHENPLRCPVKLYEFYLSKCPESTKNRNDMFYLQPERSCVPDSPVWYSAQLLNRFNMEKMLDRLLMVREVQEHMLADQATN